MEEYDKGDVSDAQAFASIKAIVNYHIEREFKELTKKER